MRSSTGFADTGLLSLSTYTTNITLKSLNIHNVKSHHIYILSEPGAPFFGLSHHCHHCYHGQAYK